MYDNLDSRHHLWMQDRFLEKSRQYRHQIDAIVFRRKWNYLADAGTGRFSPSGCFRKRRIYNLLYQEILSTVKYTVDNGYHLFNP
ncbi:hypothetical protein NPIL_692061 [Nephila pilipes]|uniref:Uncharacterized protein n=1 Tax=Nephila pilipes TaxID=299642 RepID=A0A8X6NYV6_NEPPI|nr:hypothetical protein NPIL_692061 [Nephila pilipes]